MKVFLGEKPLFYNESSEAESEISRIKRTLITRAETQDRDGGSTPSETEKQDQSTEEHQVSSGWNNCQLPGQFLKLLLQTWQLSRITRRSLKCLLNRSHPTLKSQGVGRESQVSIVSRITQVGPMCTQALCLRLSWFSLSSRRKEHDNLHCD